MEGGGAGAGSREWTNRCEEGSGDESMQQHRDAPSVVPGSTAVHRLEFTEVRGRRWTFAQPTSVLLYSVLLYVLVYLLPAYEKRFSECTKLLLRNQQLHVLTTVGTSWTRKKGQ